MSASSKKRALRSLSALERVRRHEEKKALWELARSRRALEEKRGCVEARRQRRQAAARAATAECCAAVQGAGDGGLLRQRLFLELLRRCELESADEFLRRQEQWSEQRLFYEKARSRRRLVETLRNRRQKELRADERAEAETLEGIRPSAAACLGEDVGTCKR